MPEEPVAKPLLVITKANPADTVKADSVPTREADENSANGRDDPEDGVEEEGEGQKQDAAVPVDPAPSGEFAQSLSQVSASLFMLGSNLAAREMRAAIVTGDQKPLSLRICATQSSWPLAASTGVGSPDRMPWLA